MPSTKPGERGAQRKIEGIGDEWYRVTRDMVIEVYNALGINE